MPCSPKTFIYIQISLLFITAGPRKNKNVNKKNIILSPNRNIIKNPANNKQNFLLQESTQETLNHE